MAHWQMAAPRDISLPFSDHMPFWLNAIQEQPCSPNSIFRHSLFTGCWRSTLYLRTLYSAFIDLEKAFDPVPWKVLWWALRSLRVEECTVRVIQGTYCKAWSHVWVYLWPPPGCLNNPIFSNLGLCAACWAYFMCHHKLWSTSVSHPFSSLNSSSGFVGGKQYQRITIPIFRLVHRNFIIPGCSPYILFYCYLFSLLSSGWFVIAVCGSDSVRELVKYLGPL